MSTKIDKNELKGPDAFVSTTDHIFAWIERHSKTMGAAAAAALVLGVGFVGYSFLQSRAETKAAEALFVPQNELKKAESKVREERTKKMQEAAGLNSKEKMAVKPETLRPVDFKADYAPAVEKIKVQIQKNSSTKAALVAALELSGFLLQEKQYSEALNVLDLVSFTPNHKDVLGGFWWMHRGLVLLENQKYDDAAKAFQAIVDSASLKVFHPEAMLKLGVIYEQKGDAAKARQTYEKLGKEFPESEASSSAQQFLRLLDLKSQQG